MITKVKLPRCKFFLSYYLIGINLILILIFIQKFYFDSSNSSVYTIDNSIPEEQNTRRNVSNFSNFEKENFSVLGRRLFLHEHIGIPQKRQFLIYVHEFGPYLERKFLRHYTNKQKDPFEICSVNNCKITYNESKFSTADAVLFHMHKIRGPPLELKRTNYNQRWVWMTDESIFNIFSSAKDKNLDHYNGIFNWSMNYRSDSDVPVPYGRTIALQSSPEIKLINYFKKNEKNIAAMISSCSNRNGRMRYVHALQKHVKIDVYGGCGNLSCPGHFRQDCPLLINYKFYLAFENSNCREYITEKAWWNSFEKGAVPIVMGAEKQDYLKFFPPNSFIHIEDFESPAKLAEYIKYLLENEEEYNKYHSWRSHFKVLNEHGYFQTPDYHYCRLCEALNYNDPTPKTYNDMKAFWNLDRDCNRRVFA